jgi:signal transduction histidine kinase
MFIPTQSTRTPDELALLITDQVSAMLAYWDRNLVCRFANNAYVEWFGRPKEEMINKIRLDELLGPLFQKNLPYINGALAGKRQLFEREIPTPDGSGLRQSLATYIPDIRHGVVLGFFVHVADVSYVKNLEKSIADSKREILRKIIETEEVEKKRLVDILREGVNQRLAACKMTLESERKKAADQNLYNIVELQISEIIAEINLLCQDLSPTEIEILGIVEATKHYLLKMAKEKNKLIDFIYEDADLEKIILQDKLSIFRIIQNLLKIGFDSAAVDNMKVALKYKAPCVNIRLFSNCKIAQNVNLKAYNEIACRVDYYAGKISEISSDSESIIEIVFSVTTR